MFELDRHVKRYCRRMMPGPFRRNQRLELEDHLHCMVEELAGQGNGLEQAFEIAIRRLGRKESLKAEYRKNVRWFDCFNNRRIQVATLAVGCAVVLAVCMVWRNEEMLTQARSLLIALCNIPNSLFGSTA